MALYGSLRLCRSLAGVRSVGSEVASFLRPFERYALDRQKHPLLTSNDMENLGVSGVVA